MRPPVRSEKRAPLRFGLELFELPREVLRGGDVRLLDVPRDLFALPLDDHRGDAFDAVLFDTEFFDSDEVVEIVITNIEPCVNYSPGSSTRWDIAANDALFADFDPSMYNITVGKTRGIDDWMEAEDPLPDDEDYMVPHILVVPYTNWPAPDEGQTVTDVAAYENFDDYYKTQDSTYEDWYEP